MDTDSLCFMKRDVLGKEKRDLYMRNLIIVFVILLCHLVKERCLVCDSFKSICTHFKAVARQMMSE